MNSSFSMFEEGKLSKAIEAALSAVRADPGSVDRRLELISYLCFNNLFEKADTHINVLMEQHADLVADMLVYRALIKAELARRQCFEEGRLPNFAEPPPPAITEVLRALTEIKDSPQNAATILRGAIAQAPPIKVIIDETTHSYFGDVDERMALFIEAFTLGGDYYWLPLTSLRKIEFGNAKFPLEILWRQTSFITSTHDEITGYVPGIYPGTYKSREEALLLGRAAEFSENPHHPTEGLGGRIFQIGDNFVPMSQLSSIEIVS
jgi:type VI secretion system protein ImpE